ncbi:MAG: hypothetical protein FWF92_08255 [Oscillospiraceae bacterium]|nr:hypothetical protein [Oscillospiraceae bacterium]
MDEIESSDNNLTEIIYNAYDIIGNLTPIKNADCGKLCDKICCKGDNAGMLLFPGEEDIFDGILGFHIEEIEYMETPGIKLLLCDGECTRALRPFACRMFPVAPFIDKAGNITAVPDIRARRMCPLWDLKYADKNFIRAVKKAFELLAQNKKIFSFMRLISSEIDELKRFYKK